jgi:hypothetical protein
VRSLFLLIGLMVLGCGPQRRIDPCSPSATGVQDPPVLVSFVGQPVDVELLLPPAVFCPGGNPVSTAVTTEVLDAMNRPIAHVHSDPSSSNTAGYTTRVTFTPTSAGVHYISARFEPALGITQRQLQVALERSGETPWQRTNLGAVCEEVLPLREAVLCRRGSQVTLVRDGGVELTETVTAIASSGSAGWLWTDTRLSRLFDVDGGVERADFPIAAGRSAFAVTEDRWVQATVAGFHEVSFVDGGLGLRVRTGTGDVSGPNLVISGDTIGWASNTNLCALAPDAGVRCIDSPLQPNANEGNVLWLRGADTGVMAQARFDANGSDPSVIFVPAQPTALLDARFSRPIFSYDGRLVAVRPDDFSFEAWRSPGVIARQTVTDAFVVFQLQSGETVIYRR